MLITCTNVDWAKDWNMKCLGNLIKVLKLFNGLIKSSSIHYNFLTTIETKYKTMGEATKKHFMDKLIVERLEMSNGTFIELLCDNHS
jgi:hypothetical protein